MSRLYSGQTDRAASCPSAAEEQAKIRQQSRVLDWVVGSAVAMHLLVVVGVLWLARAQASAYAEHSLAAPAQPAQHPSAHAAATSYPPVRSQPAAVAPLPPVHWSAALSKDRSAPWRVDANGHVVSSR